MSHKASLAAALLFAAGSAAAFSGNELANACKDLALRESTQSRIACLAYFRGYMDALTLAPQDKICLPSGATVDQLGRVYLKYAEKTPEQVHEPAFMGVAAALAVAFPCPVPAR